MTRQPNGRVLPNPGHLLTIKVIKGAWRPSGSVGGVGVFAVVWSTPDGQAWAPLHDFNEEAQVSLLAECRRADRLAGYPGAWPEGRAA